MVQVKRTFAAGKMNKVVDERLLPPGEYIDAQNLRLGSTEASEIGAIELTKGNSKVTILSFNGTVLSDQRDVLGLFQMMLQKLFIGLCMTLLGQGKE